MDNKENKSGEQKDLSGDEKKEPPKQTDYKTIENEIKEDLDTNPKYKKYFEKFNKSSVERFKSNYIGRKRDVILYGGKALADEEHRILRYALLAEEYIWHIQQRKLFDLQCRWRAEEIKIKEIAISGEFTEWSEKIEICPFLTPINDEEFKLYMSFIESAKMEDISTNNMTMWQEYDEFKLQYTDIESDNYEYEIPGWYEYYENNTGLGSLYMLDDIRGRKEKFYMKIWREHYWKKWEEENRNKVKPEIDDRPSLKYYDDDVMTDFLRQFENGNFINRWHAYYKNRDDEDERELEYAVVTLSDASEEWPINYNKNWRQGILDAANEYTRKKLLEELPKAYKDYLFRIKSGLGFELHFQSKYSFGSSSNKERILDGRELNGEPRDFNF